MKNLTLRLFFITIASLGILNTVDAKTASVKTKIEIQSVRNKSSEALLRKSVQDMLNLINGHMVVPAEIFMVNGGGGPESDQGMITIRYPFYSDNLRKSAKDSLGINIHEVGHQIFLETLNKWFKKEPEVIWAFFTRVDNTAGIESRDYIDASKSLTKYKDTPSEVIEEKFIKYVELAVTYNELFADTIAVFTLKDPDGIYRSIHFASLAKSEDSITRDFQASHELRRFNVDHTFDPSKNSFESGQHSVLAPTRTFIWRELYLKYKKDHPKVADGEILARIVKSITLSLKEITKDFEIAPDQITASEMNNHLQKTLREEFR